MSEPGRPRQPWDRTPVDRREYFELLGPGLVAVVPGRRPGGPGSSEWRPPTGGSWVHVGEDGRIRGFTGKAEVGQGTRTALTLVVAAELRTDPRDVQLVMGDTDLCPWDMGTFGSRSMPDAAPAVAAAAGAARAGLIALAAEATGLPAAELVAADGTVRVPGRPDGIAFRDLVRGGRHLIVVGPGPTGGSASSWQPTAGASVDLDGEAVVTGRRAYASDLARPGMQHGAVLWPPAYGARLADAPSRFDRVPPGVLLVRDGDLIGAVASNPMAARAALQQLPVRWEVPAQPGEREIEEYLRTHPSDGDNWDTDEQVVGDLEGALSGARWTIEATYRSAYIAHVPLEPHCAVAEWEGSRLTVWVGTQTPFRLRGLLAQALQLPEDDVRVIVPPTGSGFGGKHGGEVALSAARLARAAGRPVRVAFTREEEFRHAYFRPMSVIDVRAGADESGRLVAWGFVNVNGGAAALLPPYPVPNQKVGNVLSRSPLPQGSLRALAANPNNFARESVVDDLARHAGLDPLEFRERNLDDERLRSVLRRAASLAAWSDRRASPGRGYGLALGLEKGGRVATVAEVSVGGDRRVRVDRLVTVFEAGAVVNRDTLRNQVEGAQVMALGEALFEAIRFDRGVVLNPRLSQYRVPRFSDLPRIDVELVDAVGHPPAGAGETPMIAVAPAVANAVCDATGVRLRSLPLLPTGRVPARIGG